MLPQTKKTFGRTLTLGFLLATVGFCYATSTAVSRSSSSVLPLSDTAAPRAVGSATLRFLNPLIARNVFPRPDDFDLGDACFGSSMTRYISVTGGVRPYQIIPVDLPTVLAAANVNSSLQLGPSGCLMGTVAGALQLPVLPNNLGNALVFSATAIDSRGTNASVGGATGVFHLNIYTCGSAAIFRFAVDRVNNGVLGSSYISKVETLGGAQPVQFSMVPNSLVVNGVARPNTPLETLGLTLAADGTLYGRPIVAGRIQFTAHALDGARKVATARDPASTAPDQLITMDVEDNKVVATDCTTLTCSIRGEIERLNRDTVTLSGIVNLGGIGFRQIQQADVTLRIGGTSFSGRLTSGGLLRDPRTNSNLIFPDGSRMTLKINPHTGILMAKITKTSLQLALGAPSLPPGTSVKRVAFGVDICNFVISSEMLEFVSRRSGNNYRLEYKLNKSGQPLGGAFQMISVRGKDTRTIAGTEGDAWSVKFLSVPRFGVDANPGLNNASAIGVRIGTGFIERFDSRFLVANGSGVRLIKPRTKGELLSSFSSNFKTSVSSFTTFPLDRRTTGIPRAVFPGAAANAFFTLGFDVDRGGTAPGYTGEIGKSIVASKVGAWVDR